MVVWLVGLSGAGKTTIGEALCAHWRQTTPNVVLVDGDQVRKFWGVDQLAQDYSLEARRQNAQRIVECCRWLDRQGIHVVCSILCIFDDIMTANRGLFEEYLQVHLQCSLPTLQHRDPKGLYSEASKGSDGPIVGIDIPYSAPINCDLTLSTDKGSPPPDHLARQIFTLIQGRLG